jgi:hypothetical protein
MILYNSCYNRDMTYIQSLRTRLAATSKLTYALLFAVAWLVAALFAWFQVVYQSPENVFRGMLKNNFATTGFARESNSSQNSVSSEEVSQLQLGSDALLQTATALKQGGDAVTTTTISTDSKNYVRYSSIKTDRKDANGKPLDFSKAVNVWAVNDTEATGSNQAVAQMMLGLMPLGNVTAQNRAALLKQIDETEAITANYKTVKKETKNGRLQYTYEVKILPVPYLQMLKKYGQAAGLGDQVASLNPDDYKDTPTTNIQLTIDARSRHLVSYSIEGQSAAETYSAFGVRKSVKIPKNTISTDELQKRLNVQ